MLNYSKFSEEISGIIDYNKKMIKLIDEDQVKGFKEKGMINLNHVRKIEVIKKIGCLGPSSEIDICETDYFLSYPEIRLPRQTR